MSLDDSLKAGPSHHTSLDTLQGERSDASDDYLEADGEEAGAPNDSESDPDDGETSLSSVEPDPVDRKGKGVAYSEEVPWETFTSPPAPKKSSWIDLDLSIIVAIVSPIGNWLTGGDHIKHLILVILLVFYLHQLIEIPWQLYQSSLPRRSPKPRSSKADERLAALARSSLTYQEGVYLLLTILSPLLGALFIKRVIFALGAAESLSWFSTTLFVLATGIRPWSHLVARLKSRTQILHDVVHYPSEDSAAHHRVETDRVIVTLLARIDALEGGLKDARKKLEKAENLERVCDDLSEALEEAEQSRKRTERKAEAVRNAMAGRIDVLGARLAQLEQRQKQETRSDLVPAAQKQMSKWMHDVVHALWFLGNPSSPPPKHRLLGSTTSNGEPVSPTLTSNGHGAKSGIRSPERDRLGQHAPRLATIPEAGDSELDSDGTYVSENEERMRSPAKPRIIRIRNRSSSVGKVRDRRKTRSCGEALFQFVQCLVLWPYRASARVLVTLIPPARNILI